MKLADDTVKQRAVVNAAVRLGIIKNVGNFLNS